MRPTADASPSQARRFATKSVAILALCLAIATVAPTEEAQARFGHGGGRSFGGGHAMQGGGFRGGFRGSHRVEHNSYGGRGSAYGHSRRYSRVSEPPAGWNDRPLDRAPRFDHNPERPQPISRGHRHGDHRYGYRYERPIHSRRYYEPDPAPTVTSPPTLVAAPPPPPPPPSAPFVSPPPSAPTPAVAVAAPLDSRFVRDEVLLVTKADGADVLSGIAQRHRLAELSTQRIDLLGLTLHRFRVLGGTEVPTVVAALGTDQQVAFAQPNYLFELSADAAKPGAMTGAQYALAKIHQPQALKLTQGDNTLVAVIDSGIDVTNPELAGAIAGRFDAVGGNTTPDAHGTAIAGIIAAHGQLEGVAPHAKLLAIRAFSDAAGKPGAEGTTANIVAGIEWAYEHKARVINMSFAGPHDALLAKLLKVAHDKGEVLVAAVGNEGPNSAPLYPAADPNVIAVTATDRNDKVLDTATRGAYASLAAPGADILVAAPAGAYQYSSGTSMAAAHISGIVALLLSQKPDLDPDTVRGLLAKTGRGTPGQNGGTPLRLGDAFAAVETVALAEEDTDSTAAEQALRRSVGTPESPAKPSITAIQ